MDLGGRGKRVPAPEKQAYLLRYIDMDELDPNPGPLRMECSAVRAVAIIRPTPNY